jgi:uncharacterized protein (TIGR01244 family)
MNTILRFLCSIAASAAIVASVQAAQGAQKRQEPQKLTVPGVTNFTKVDDTVACGGALTGNAVSELKQRGYKAIINFRLATEPGANVRAEADAAEESSIRYIHLPFEANSPDPAVVDAFLKAVADPGNHPVFVHCGSANRVGAMWLIKRVLQDGWSVDRASKEAEIIGLTSPGLKEFALSYIRAHAKK